MNNKEKETMQFPKGLHIYYYNRKGQMVGVFAAAATKFLDNYYAIGWSLCNTKSGDLFNKNLAKKIAYDRAVMSCNSKIPTSMQEEYLTFSKIAAKYFKDKKFIGNIFSE